jgi:hypothetical protein
MKNKKYARTLEKQIKNVKPKESFFNNSLKEVPYPEELSEAEITATLYNELKKKSLDARLEVRTNDCDENGKVTCSFDVVVYDNKRAFCIIEVKKKVPKSHFKGFQKQLNSKQAIKYSKYDSEIFYCVGIGMVDSIVKRVKNLSLT